VIGKKEPVFRGRLENLPSAAAALTSSHDGSRRDSGIFYFSVPSTTERKIKVDNMMLINQRYFYIIIIVLIN